MTLLPAILFVVGAYFWGAIPSGYLVARFKSGIDIRNYGSGNIGATNVMEHSGKITGLLLGFFDSLGKGALPVILVRLAGEDTAVQVATGLAAIVGHNWSVFVGFKGGRGVATAMGVSLAFKLWPEAVIIGALLVVVGRLVFKETGFVTFVSLLVLPVLTVVFTRPVEVQVMTVMFAVLLFTKRLTANWEFPPKEYPLARVLMYRLLWDRDVAEKTQWKDRRPQFEPEEP